MKASALKDMNCSLAQTVEVMGDRWTVMVLRDAFFGVRHFDEFQQRLGLARNILVDRLKHLVAHGVMEKHGGSTRRTEYRLTEKGWDLVTVLIAIAHWGDRHRPNPKGARAVFKDPTTGEPIARVGLRAADGREVDPRSLIIERGPGLASKPMETGGSDDC